MWLLTRACFYLEGGDVGLDPIVDDAASSAGFQPSLETDCRSVRSVAAGYLLEFVDQGLQAFARGWRGAARLVLEALVCLYSHATRSEARNVVRPVSDAMACYKQYLLACVYLFVSRILPAQGFHRVKLSDPSDPWLKDFTLRLAFLLPTWLTARTKESMTCDAFRSCEGLCSASAYVRKQRPKAATHLAEASQDNAKDAGPLWIRWSLMWNAIPDVVKQMMDYTPKDFVAPLDFLLSSPEREGRAVNIRPERSLRDWDCVTRLFLDRVLDLVVGCCWEEESDTEKLTVLVRDINDIRTGLYHTRLSWDTPLAPLRNIRISKHAQNLFRWGLIAWHCLTGLLDSDTADLFMEGRMEMERYRIHVQGDTTDERVENTIEHLAYLSRVGRKLCEYNTTFMRAVAEVTSPRGTELDPEAILESTTSGLAGLP